MRTIITTLLGALLLMLTSPPGARAQEPLHSLQSLRWEYRLLLIKAPGDMAAGIRAKLLDSKAELEERHMAWLLLSGGMLESSLDRDMPPALASELEEQYFDPGLDRQVLLVGKDGGIKSRTETLDLEMEFGLVDAMPMRQREMREGENP